MVDANNNAVEDNANANISFRADNEPASKTDENTEVKVEQPNNSLIKASEIHEEEKRSPHAMDAENIAITETYEVLAAEMKETSKILETDEPQYEDELHDKEAEDNHEEVVNKSKEDDLIVDKEADTEINEKELQSEEVKQEEKNEVSPNEPQEDYKVIEEAQIIQESPKKTDEEVKEEKVEQEPTSNQEESSPKQPEEEKIPMEDTEDNKPQNVEQCQDKESTEEPFEYIKDSITLETKKEPLTDDAMTLTPERKVEDDAEEI